jgi:3-hydroxyisobutyrate dehydrogenase-like beta-hydroxyacid dehydrogenase
MGFHRIAIPVITGVSDEQAREAALFLTGHAKNAEDARNLLEACGLVPYESGTNGKSRPEKSPVIKYPVAGQ